MVKREMSTQAPEPTVTYLRASTTSAVDSSTLLKSSSPSTGRLLVLVSADSDYSSAIPRIWQLASSTGRRVHLLGLSKDLTQEPSLQRQLIAITALLNDGQVRTEVHSEFGTRWMDAVRRHYQMGDILVCFAEQRDGLLHKPLQQVLEANLDMPVFILSDLHVHRSSTRNMLAEILLWVGLLGIVVGAFLLQTRLMSLPHDWIQTTLMLVCVFAEFWLLRAWNNLFR